MRDLMAINGDFEFIDVHIAEMQDLIVKHQVSILNKFSSNIEKICSDSVIIIINRNFYTEL